MGHFMTMQANTTFHLASGEVAKIEQCIRKEIALYDQYLEVLKKERGHVVTFAPDAIALCAAERSRLFDEVLALKTKREGLYADLASEGPRSLTDMIHTECHEHDMKRVLPLVELLQDKVKLCQQRSEELGKTVAFASSLVQGTMSILWSTTHSITTVYGKSGKVEEKYQRSSDQALTALKQA